MLEDLMDALGIWLVLAVLATVGCAALLAGARRAASDLRGAPAPPPRAR